MTVLRIKDESGNWIGISTIKGDKGVDGITESGDTYIKFFDGTLICRGGTDINEVYIASSKSVDISFPVPFIDDTYDVTVSLLGGVTGWCYLHTTIENKTATGFRVTLKNNDDVIPIGAGMRVSYIAMGKWK